MGVASTIAIAPAGALEAKLSCFARLRREDLIALHRGLSDPRVHPVRSDVLEDDNRAVRVVTSGWVGLTRTLSDGRRQILQIAIAGDLVAAPRATDEHAIALTAARSADARDLVGLIDGEQDASVGLGKAWRMAQDDAKRQLLDQIVRLGSLSAYERTADLVVELAERHGRAGIGDGARIPWPITQEVLSDILGLSIVHVNRVLQQLRREGLIEIRAGVLVVCDRARLADVSGARSEREAR